MCEIQFRLECSPHITLVAYSFHIILKNRHTHLPSPVSHALGQWRREGGCRIAHLTVLVLDHDQLDTHLLYFTIHLL